MCLPCSSCKNSWHAERPHQPATIPRADRAGRRPDAAHLVLPDQRRIPLPRAVTGGAAVRPCRRAGRGMAAHHLGGGGVRPMASPMAHPADRRPVPAPRVPRAGRGAGRDELPVQPGRGRRADAPERAGPGPGRRRGVRPDRGAAVQPAAGLRFRVRQLHRLHALRDARPPHREYRRRRRRLACVADERNRPARPVHAHRGPRGHAVRDRPGRALLHPPGVASLGNRRRALLLGDPVCHRPARHGAATAHDLRPHARAAPGRRDRHRPDRARSGPDPAGHRRYWPRHRRRRDSSRSSPPGRCARAGRTPRGVAMRYVNLGGCGLKVSQIGLGMMSYGDPASQQWALNTGSAEPIVRQAVEAGVTFFDTADMYSDGASEEITGRLLGRLFPRRDDFVLATKVYYPTGPGANDRGLSRMHILASIESSLKRLGTGHVDLYQIHRWDEGTPIEETMSALHDVVRAGQARYIGASAMFAWQFAKAQYTAQIGGWTRFVSMQNRYNLVNREDEREMIPFCLDQGIGVVPYSPLARGLLAGTRERTGKQRTARARAGNSPSRPADFDVADAVTAVASQRNLPPAQIALAWLLGRPGVSAPIVGATKPGHLLDATEALDVSLSDDEVAQLESRYLPRG